MGMSKHPRPVWRRAMDMWPTDKFEDWQERAAMIEYLAEFPREAAERKAFDIVANMRSLPPTAEICPCPKCKS